MIFGLISKNTGMLPVIVGVLMVVLAFIFLFSLQNFCLMCKLRETSMQMLQNSVNQAYAYSICWTHTHTNICDREEEESENACRFLYSPRMLAFERLER